jgi:hypothetical protein
VAFYRSHVAALAIGDMRVNQFLPRLRELRTLLSTFRSFFMSPSDRGRGDVPGARQEPVTTGSTPAPAEATDPYPNWLDRMQRARARHAAITKNLYTWSNYKNWADKMRDNWEDDESAAKGIPAPGLKPPLPRK